MNDVESKDAVITVAIVDEENKSHNGAIIDFSIKEQPSNLPVLSSLKLYIFMILLNFTTRGCIAVFFISLN